MSGHGHVIKNPNGILARCGGPALCSVCREEQRLGRWLTPEEEKAVIRKAQAGREDQKR